MVHGQGSHEACGRELPPVSPSTLAQPLPEALGLRPFRPRLPWLNGDLQTLRDSLRPVRVPAAAGLRLEIPVPAAAAHRPPGSGVTPDRPDRLLALLDPALGEALEPLGLVVLVHGLGGSSEREGLRRMGWTLQRAGFAVLRLNLRGAGLGRGLAGGSYAASCNADLLPALRCARELADGLAADGRPLFAMGISLGGTMLLNALLASAEEHGAAGLMGPLLDGLVCISSPLDLQACSHQIERPRNALYQRWLLQRLLAQIQADPHGLSVAETEAAAGRTPEGSIASIRAFDAVFTAPRWGYASVQDYYRQASPWPRLLHHAGGLPPALILHAADDPWVPVQATGLLAQSALDSSQGGPWQVLITPQGGHNGFHASCDRTAQLGGCWGDRLTARWLQRLVAMLQPAASEHLETHNQR